MNIDSAAVQMQSSALGEVTQAGDQKEQAERAAERAAEQHLHHCGYLLGKLTKTFCLLKSTTIHYLFIFYTLYIYLELQQLINY